MAAAVVHQPALLLADEATVGQDRLTWSAVMGIVEALRDAGSAVVLTTHDDAVVTRADRTVVLERPAQPALPAQPRRSLVARCGPLSLLAGSALAVPAGVLAPHWTTSLAVLATQAALAVIGLLAPGEGPRPRGRLTRVLVRFLPGVIGAASVALVDVAVRDPRPGGGGRGGPAGAHHRVPLGGAHPVRRPRCPR